MKINDFLLDLKLSCNEFKAENKKIQLDIPPMNESHLAYLSKTSFHTDKTTDNPAKNIIAVPIMINTSVVAHSGGKCGLVHTSS